MIKDVIWNLKLKGGSEIINKEAKQDDREYRFKQ
jgi:hypothetical protein